MKPVTKFDLKIAQSGNFRLVMNVDGGPDSLAGYGCEMQIRKTKGSDAVLAEMDPDWFTIDDLNRQVVLDIPDEATATYDWNGQAYYDLYLVDGTDRWRAIEGRACLDKTVTREG